MIYETALCRDITQRDFGIRSTFPKSKIICSFLYLICRLEQGCHNIVLIQNSRQRTGFTARHNRLALTCLHEKRGDKPKACLPLLKLFAEGEGFKPPIPAMGIPDFESSAFGHSANLPFPARAAPLAEPSAAFNGCKGNTNISHGKEKRHSNESFSSLALSFPASDRLMASLISHVPP